MQRILFEFGGISFYTHGTFLVLGVVFSVLSLLFLTKKNKFNQKLLYDLVLYVLVFGLIGARVLNYLLYFKQYENAFQIFTLNMGGLVSWGGFVVGAVVAYLVIKKNKEPILRWFDILAISLLLGISVLRLGSFLSGESFGVQYSGFLSSQGRFPTTLVESIWVLVVFLIIFVWYNVRRGKITGSYFFAVIALYSMGRFVTDFSREEARVLLGMSFGQIFALVVSIIGALLYIKLIGSSRRWRQNDIERIPTKTKKDT